MIGRVTAVCVSGPRPIRLPRAGDTQSAIDKRPVAGRVAVHRLGLDGDVQVNRKFHGGEGQALYAYAQEDADWWSAELDRPLPAGMFGENLRTTGVDLTGAVPMRQRSPSSAPVRSIPVVRRFSPNIPGGSWRSSSAAHQSASSWAYA